MSNLTNFILLFLVASTECFVYGQDNTEKNNIKKMLHSKYWNDSTSIQEMAAIGPKIIPALIEIHKEYRTEPHSIKKANVAYVLASISLTDKNFLHILFKTFSTDDDVYRDVVDAFKRIGIKAVPILKEELKNEDVMIRFYTAQTLSGIGPPAVEAIPDLLIALGDKNVCVGGFAAHALATIGGKSVVPSLIDALKNKENAQIRGFAAAALELVGKEAEPSIPHLIEALSDKEWFVRRNSASALGKIGVKSDKLISALSFLKTNDPISKVKEAAASAIANLTINELGKKTGD